MQIGDVIRKYRKDKNITQSEMANRLGVTAPAVNKWENGNSLPDVALLSPIARLLNISVDTLLSHEQELSDAEANRLVENVLEKLKTESFGEVLQWIKQRITEYPNCYSLILWMAQVFDGKRKMAKLPDDEQYDAYILDCYKRVLESENQGLRMGAAEALYYFYIHKEQYEQAEEYLAYLSQENPERKRKQAMICGKTGREQEAYKMYEELLYAGFQSASLTFHDIYLLALNEKDFEKAHLLVDKMRGLAELYEFGEYHEVSVGLELAALEKDEAESLRIAERMLTNLESLYDMTKSRLYTHMGFKKLDEASLPQMREELLDGLRDEETFGFLSGNQKWQELVGLPEQA
jgi:transcriptional regulator with XRE-family HTH domain